VSSKRGETMEAITPTALVVEDSPFLRRYLRLRLESSGWKVVEAAEAFEGMKAFREVQPDLVTLDLIMPINNGIDGIHLARQIREEAPSIPLFIVSAMASERGVRDFLVKHRLEFFPKTAESPNDGFAKLFARTDSILRGLKEQQQSRSEW
jgi:two-component system chemotaxis response regulator CheY